MRRIPTIRIEIPTVSAARTATTVLSERDRSARDAASLLVEHDRDEAPVEERDRGQRDAAEREHDPEVVPGHGEDRAEEELEEPDVEAVRARDEDDAERDPGVEDERERLVAGRPAARAEPFDRERADDGEAERRQHGRDAEQVARGDTGEGDVAEPVADERLPPLHEEEPDCGREDADHDADGEGEPHELEVEHQCAWEGSCQSAGRSAGAPSNTIRPRTRRRRETTCSTAPNSWET